MKLGAVVLDSGNSEVLSDFYQQLLGWKKHKPDGEWIILSDPLEKSTPLVFQETEDYERPVWPAEQSRQQQMLHLDFYVSREEYRQQVEHAIRCGAQKAATQLSEDWTVMLDPAGHPFCIIPLPPGHDLD